MKKPKKSKPTKTVLASPFLSDNQVSIWLDITIMEIILKHSN